MSELQFFSTGKSRSRIVIVTDGPKAAGAPFLFVGTRWLAFGTAKDKLIRQAKEGWAKMNTAVPGGVSSATWQTLTKGRVILPQVININPGLTAYAISAGTNRIVLFQSPTVHAVQPSRIGDTAVVVLNDAAFFQFAEWMRSLPGDTAVAAAAQDILSGGQISRLRTSMQGAGSYGRGKKETIGTLRGF